jgi:hypothetical protein
MLLLLACVPPEPAPGGSPSPPLTVDQHGGDGPAVVDCNGDGDFRTIGRAIDAAEPGDTILVRPCTYAESVDFGGKTLRLESTDGPESTIIEADGTTSVIRAEAGEGEGTAVVGFTLTGGGGTTRAAVHSDFTSLRLEDDIITGNRGIEAVYAESSDVTIVNTSFSDNRTTYGVLVWADRGSVVVTDSSFDCGSNSYAVYFSHGAAIIDRSTFDCDGRNAVGVIHAVGNVNRSVLHGGIASEQETDHYDDYLVVEDTYVDGPITQSYAALHLRNSIVRGGVTLTAPSEYTLIEGSMLMDAECGISTDSTGISLRNNLFWNNTADACGMPTPVGRQENVAADPLFVDDAGDDWHLAEGSPAIDAGPADHGYEDVDGSRNDIGIYGGPLTQDGGW